MRTLITMFLLSSEIALGSVCGKAKAEVEVSGLGINFDAEAPVNCEYTKSAGNITGEFTVKIEDLKTGIALRDEHLSEALKASKNPSMKLSLSAFPLKSGPLTGDFTLNGQTHKVSDWKAEISGDKVIVIGKFNYTEYGLESAKYKKAGVTLATVPDIVGVRVELTL